MRLPEWPTRKEAMEDEAAIASVEAAYVQLRRRLADRVQRMYGDSLLAEDAVAEAFTGILKDFGEFAPETELRDKAVWNRIRDHLRTVRRSKSYTEAALPEEGGDEAAIHDGAPGPERQVHGRLLIEALRDAAASAPSELRRTVALILEKDHLLSGVEMAQILGIDYDVYRHRRIKALAWLRSELGRKGINGDFLS